MRILVKVGGAQLVQPAARAAFAEAVAAARDAGHELLLVHGGGDQVREWSGRLGIADRYVDGLRVTDAETARVVTAVLGGEVNRELVAALGAAGVPAVGLTGADGHLFDARPQHAPGQPPDLGYVGQVHAVDPSLPRLLMGAGHVPVVASIAPLSAGLPGARDRFWNLNADAVVAPLASALAVDAVLFLTDVPAVRDAEGHDLRVVTPRGARALRESGALAGGMLPKVQAALAAAAARPRALVRIAPAAGRDAVLEALAPDTGTRFLAREETSWTTT